MVRRDLEGGGGGLSAQSGMKVVRYPERGFLLKLDFTRTCAEGKGEGSGAWKGQAKDLHQSPIFFKEKHSLL